MWKINKFIIIISITFVSVILFANRALLQDAYSVLVKRADALNYQGDFLVVERRYSEATQLRDKAKEIYKQAIQLQPNNPLAYDRIGLIYSSLGQRKEAVEMFSRAIELDHNYSSGYYHLGLEYREQGNNQEAIMAFKQAIRLDPKDSSPYFALGLTYRKLGRFQDAIDAYEQRIRLEPERSAGVYIELGVAYSILGKHYKAISSLKKGIEIIPTSASGHYELGLAYLREGNRAAALQEYKILQTLDRDLANKLLSRLTQ